MKMSDLELSPEQRTAFKAILEPPEPTLILDPWYRARDSTDMRKTFPGGPSLLPLLPFARRLDQDQWACIEVKYNRIHAIVEVHTWTSSGYTITGRFNTVWDWMRHVIDDAEEWANLLAADPDGTT